MVPVLICRLPVVQVDQHVRQILVQSVLDVGRRAASCRVILLGSLLVLALVSMALCTTRTVGITLVGTVVLLVVHCSSSLLVLILLL